MFTCKRHNRKALALTAFAAGLLCLSSCAGRLSPDVPGPMDAVTVDAQAAGFSAAFSHRDGEGAYVALQLAPGTIEGDYGVSVRCTGTDGGTVYGTEGDVHLAPGVARTMFLPLGDNAEDIILRCTLTGKGGIPSTETLTIPADDDSEGTVFRYGQSSPATVEMNVGRTSVLSYDLLPGGADIDVLATKGGEDILVERNAFGLNVTPLSEGTYDIIAKNGDSTAKLTVRAVNGSAVPSVSLPERIVLMKDAETMLVAAPMPYGPALSDCSWSVDAGNTVSVTPCGSMARLMGLSEGTARVTFSSSTGTATTTVTVIKAGAIKRVTSVTITPSELNLGKGEEASVSVTYEPSDAVLGKIRWSISGQEDAIGLEAFELSGTVTGLRRGDATVTVDIDGVKASLDVRVICGEEQDTQPEPTGDILMPERIVMLLGAESVIRARFDNDRQPSDCSWSLTGNGFVEIVRADGPTVFLKALKEGQTDIVLTSGDSVGVTHVTIIGAPGSEPEQPEQPGGDIETLESVTLPATVSLTEGESTELTATLHPSAYVPESVSWSCSSDNGAELTLSKSGTKAGITAVKAGTAVVTVNVDGRIASTTVTVEAKPEEPEEPEKPAGIESVTLAASPAETVTVGAGIRITASVTPGDYVPAKAEWSVAPTGVFELTPDGMSVTATAVSHGTATVTLNVDGTAKSVQLTATKPEPAYTASINGTEFFAGQTVRLSFTGSPVSGMTTEVTLDGKNVTFSANGVTSAGIAAGSHTYAVTQRIGQYTVDRKEFNFTVYETPVPSVTVTGNDGTETFSSYVCIRRNRTVSLNATCQGSDGFDYKLDDSAESVFTTVAGGYFSRNTGETAICWTARKGGARTSGTIPVVVYDAISVKVSAYNKSLSADSCYLTLDVTGNDYGSVTASGVTFVPQYRIPLPDGQEIRYTGSTIAAGTVDMTLGARSEYNIGADVAACQDFLSAAGYNLSDVSAIYIGLKVSGTLSSKYLAVSGQGEEIIGALTGNNEILKKYFEKDAK